MADGKHACKTEPNARALFGKANRFTVQSVSRFTLLLHVINNKQGAAIRRINDQTQYSKNAMLKGSKLVKMTSLGVI
eukprot:scaffold3374_cov267-Chaetoceros_neogracile.AAC.6